MRCLFDTWFLTLSSVEWGYYFLVRVAKVTDLNISAREREAATTKLQRSLPRLEITKGVGEVFSEIGVYCLFTR
jgi:hypothetical protein